MSNIFMSGRALRSSLNSNRRLYSKYKQSKSVYIFINTFTHKKETLSQPVAQRIIQVIHSNKERK